MARSLRWSVRLWSNCLGLMEWVAVNRSNFSGRKDKGQTFWSNGRDRMECDRILSYLLYGSVASLPSPSSNIEAWPYGTSLRFAPAFRALGVCEHIWRDIWATLLSPKWAEIFVAQMAGDEMSLPRCLWATFCSSFVIISLSSNT